VSDSKGGIYNPDGLEFEPPRHYKQETRSVVGMLGTQSITNADLLELDVSVLLPAALEQVITAKNAQNVKARIVAELANGPT
jgi:glutamate dehydrogenase (NAD(P)+)